MQRHLGLIGERKDMKKSVVDDTHYINPEREKHRRRIQKERKRKDSYRPKQGRRRQDQYEDSDVIDPEDYEVEDL